MKNKIVMVFIVAGMMLLFQSVVAEDTLDTILQKYCNESTGNTGYSELVGKEVFDAVAGKTYNATCIDKQAGWTQVFGWYEANNINTKHLIFNNPTKGSTALYTPTVNSIGFYLTPSGAGGNSWYTQQAFNTDNYDHALVYRCNNGDSDDFIIGWEDTLNGGDNDHQDLVVFTKITTAPEPTLAIAAIAALAPALGYGLVRRRNNKN